MSGDGVVVDARNSPAEFECYLCKVLHYNYRLGRYLVKQTI